MLFEKDSEKKELEEKETGKTISEKEIREDDESKDKRLLLG